MPAFSYQAVDADGKTRTGTLEADTARAARSQLRAQQLVPLQVEPLGAAVNPQAPVSTARRAFRSSQRAVWLRQLSGLVAAGLPIERALATLAEEAETPAQRAVIATLRAEVNGGSSLSRAMAMHPREFSAVSVAVVGAGEHSGQLGAVLQRLADEQEEQDNLRSKIVGAALYPMIVSAVAICIVVFLLAYVVPQVANVFASSKQALPLLTRVMLGLSSLVRENWWLLLSAIGLIAVAAYSMRSNEQFLLKIDETLLRLPLVGKLARQYNAARFASTLAMLAAAGVPILKAIQAAAETLSNRSLRAAALNALTLVREGAPLASALAHEKCFPPLLTMFTRLGEQTGQLSDMLERAATQLRAEVQRRAMNLATLLEPLLIVAMGGIVMLIVLAVMLPIIQINQLVK
ncbi:type II secretion system inner membrane protein GspF [Curvibacter sp. CHRR-16]|uniref:type II secretion system inner membrane protein GspF n=1 Tax=Curvibacter sp. CHRR-16 TaxID=2835872 RepID=UPI001BD92BB0|nr:type II secretion system inner membrane protein GspF [Curvibacter sp. CHRR-16]MBT0569146.1 type II secretion system inner membrane protein GspF [Curvibacter sp. CHRR-16]